MNLVEFNPANAGPTKRDGLSPRIRVNTKAGLFGFNENGCKLLGVKSGDQVVVFQDQDSPTDWYIEKVEKGGFIVRASKTKSNTGLWFNSVRLGKQIFASVGFEDAAGTVLIAGRSTQIGSRILFGLLTNLLLD